MKRLFNRGKWLWLESTNPLIMSYMNEKRTPATWLHQKLQVHDFFYCSLKYLFVQFIWELKDYMCLWRYFFPFINHTEYEISQYHYSSSNCLPWKMKLTLVSIKSRQQNTEVEKIMIKFLYTKGKNECEIF